MPAEGTAANTGNAGTFVVTDLQPPDATSPP